MIRRNPSLADLQDVAHAAVVLARQLDVPPVLVGALAMSAHGYSRETHDVDIAIVASGSGLAEVDAAAIRAGLAIHARHGVWGLDLRTRNGARIDVLLGFPDELSAVIADVVAEATRSQRTADVFGSTFYVASVGAIFTLKLIAERAKDRADIVEFIKSMIVDGSWDDEKYDALAFVRRHLGWYACSQIERFERTAREELGR